VARLDHIGVLVRKLEGAAAIYERLGLDVERVTIFEYEGRQIRIAFIEIADGVELELIEAPELIDAGAEPLHHVCFEVADIHRQLGQLADAGFPLADAEPREGASAPLVAFLDTAAADGVRIELAQKTV
jgi:catechol 2,3-dioxygenase-like lactoylglutathione lyase family enzyme